MAWEKTENVAHRLVGYVYKDSIHGQLEVTVTNHGTATLSFNGWAVTSNSLLELAEALLDLRKEVYGKKVLVVPYDETIITNPCAEICLDENALAKGA